MEGFLFVHLRQIDSFFVMSKDGLKKDEYIKIFHRENNPTKKEIFNDEDDNVRDTMIFNKLNGDI